MDQVESEPTQNPVPPSVAVGVAININARDAPALIRWMQDVLGFNLVARCRSAVRASRGGGRRGRYGSGTRVHRLVPIQRARP